MGVSSFPAPKMDRGAPRGGPNPASGERKGVRAWLAAAPAAVSRVFQRSSDAGARGGIYVQAAPNAYIGLGAVYEKYLDCEKGIYRTCDSTYAEVTFTLAF